MFVSSRTVTPEMLKEMVDAALRENLPKPTVAVEKMRLVNVGTSRPTSLDEPSPTPRTPLCDRATSAQVNYSLPFIQLSKRSVF